MIAVFRTPDKFHMETVAASAVVVNAKGWDFGRFSYDLRAFNPRNPVVVNGRALRGLPEPHQAALRQAMGR